MLLLLSSCQGGGLHEGGKISYYPFQTESGGRWGMVSPDGEVLFSEEFKNEPTVTVNGRFMVQNEKGNWQLFSAEKKPRQIGDEEYATAGLFVEDVAPVAEPDEPLKFIHKDGSTAFEFGTVEGKRVNMVRNFSEGLSVFCVRDSLFGAIDTKGNVVIAPGKYCYLENCGDGKFVAVKMKYCSQWMGESPDSMKVAYTVINKKGEELFDLPRAEYPWNGGEFVKGRLAVATLDNDGNLRCGIIDDKKQWVVRPSSRVRSISSMSDEVFTFVSDDGMMGLMDMEGNVLIRAKYPVLSFADRSGKYLWATNDDGSYTLVDRQDNKLSKETYVDVCWFESPKSCPVATSASNWFFIDTKGQQVGKDDFASVSTQMGDPSVINNYIDFTAIFDRLNLRPDGVFDFNLRTTSQQAIDALRPGITTSDPYSIALEDVIGGPRKAGDFEVWVDVAFNRQMGIYQAEYGKYLYDHRAHPIGFRVTFSDFKLLQRGEELYDKLCAWCDKRFGRRSADEGNTVTWGLGDGSKTYVSVVLTDPLELRGYVTRDVCLLVGRKGLNTHGSEWDLEGFAPFNYMVEEEFGETPSDGL